MSQDSMQSEYNKADLLLAEYNQDLEELNNFLALAKRKRVITVLTNEIELTKAKILQATPPGRPINTPSNSTTSTQQTANNNNQVLSPEERAKKFDSAAYSNITNFAWDQDKTDVTVFISLDGIEKIPLDSIDCRFAQRAFDLRIIGFNNKNLRFLVPKLNNLINPEKSNFKVRKNRITINLKKAVPQKSPEDEWFDLKDKEDPYKKNKQDLATGRDPSDGLMDLIKQMYNNGDEDLKKNIARAMYETKQKKDSGSLEEDHGHGHGHHHHHHHDHDHDHDHDHHDHDHHHHHSDEEKKDCKECNDQQVESQSNNTTQENSTATNQTTSTTDSSASAHSHDHDHDHHDHNH